MPLKDKSQPPPESASTPKLSASLRYSVYNYIPTLSSFPNTVLSPRAEQFQRPCLN